MRPPILLTTALLALLGISIGTAVAGPAAGPASKPGGATELCPTPDEAKCLSVDVLKGPYLDTQCGQKHKAVCKPFVEKGLEKDRGLKSAPTAKMLRPQGTDIPKELRDGKRRAYHPKPAQVIAQQGTNPIASANLTNFPPPTPPTVNQVKGKHRNPAWDANGQKITSCAEYAYERHYDWTRFTDASAACKGDDNCLIDVAMLPSTPGIANRTLKRKDGKPTVHQISVKSSGALPKNLFFAMNDRFLDAVVGPTPKFEKELRDAIRQGNEYYGLCKFGQGCGGKIKVGGEWGFHQSLHDKNRDLSSAEFQEYDRRKQKLAHLYALWVAAVAEEAPKALPNKIPNNWVSPLDEVSNPVDQMRAVSKHFATHGKLELDLKQKLGGQVPSMPRQQQGALGGSLATGMLGMVARTGPAQAGAADPGGVAVKTCDGLHGPETFFLGPISCKIGQALHKEYQRKLDGQKSCLDLADDDCDWSPLMYREQMVTGLPYLAQMAADEEYCNAWLGDTIGPGCQANLGAVDKCIADLQKDIGEELKKLAPYDQGAGSKGGKKFGTDLGEAEAYGDKGMFAAGYDYMLGWGVEPSKFDEKKSNGVCQLGGYARGGFGVDAWLIGKEIEIVDGLAGAAFNGSFQGDDATKAFGNVGNKKGLAHAHLRVLGADVFTEINETISFDHAYNPAVWEKYNRIDIPSGYKPSFTIMAGPVPISGAVWAEFFYGASFEVDAELQSETCNADNVEFVGRGIFTPALGVDGRAQVGVGIAGLLSVGIRGALNLVTVGVPVTNELIATIKNIQSVGPKPALKFVTKIGLSLATLSGWLSLYVEFLFFEEEFEILRWAGVSTTIDLMPPITAELPLMGMK